jgi:hypothetical protein
MEENMNRLFVAFVQRHYAGGVGIDQEVWPTLEEALNHRSERESMLAQIRATWDGCPSWQKHSTLEVEGDFDSGRWQSGSGRGLLEFGEVITVAGGGGTTDYETELEV